MRSSVLLLCLASGLAATPSEMRAAVLTSRPWDLKFHLDKLAVIEKAVPSPGHGEILVKVLASNINPVDHKIVQMAGMLWTYPHQLGFDLAGVVVEIGPGCSKRLQVGDEVWASDTPLSSMATTGGTFAEYAAVQEDWLGLKPKSLSMLEAGSMPMVALTGYDSLLWAAGGKQFAESTTVLILGGTGGTGHLGIQLAKAMGAGKVITTCSGSHAAFVKSLGADEVIDYHRENYYEILPSKSVDVVYDCVGQSGTGDHAYGLLKDGGRFITLLQDSKASFSTKLKRPDVKEYAPLCVRGCSRFDRIDDVAALVDGRKLKVHIDEIYDIGSIAQAFNHSFAGHTMGKIAVTMNGTQEFKEPILV
mmetsp:Transcript_66756/g.118114  ORF Transcript_66756/g.118114 Transcript_66756/m.118114 type:complete len:362 (-) Transcript_66756:209-1294(-)|eukprot:CAMPEP_0197652010 /NCGR_PEP_ID=MMETSP1338-20131121/34187_1 /TAXON_ID=43686 ORGANISM="Pelagodinium beii, Strain RCC1491" /NCGR_SAMPLE_ID=MMETSP1338 /ASSEMBLY_ACC=CAM_ASM_000754 /LENGTH=361 /DNA_ID=CAMNT_0043226793 /DNA_START=73 /DNA_END=1158 /DNA_ORIENTATION=-